jgi:hypothetical protein
LSRWPQALVRDLDNAAEAFTGLPAPPAQP